VINDLTEFQLSLLKTPKTIERVNEPKLAMKKPRNEISLPYLPASAGLPFVMRRAAELPIRLPEPVHERS
jgi:hypothetical protein